MKILKTVRSLHYDARTGPIQMLVLHATATRNLAQTWSYLIDSKAPNRVSAHYVIDRDGTIYQLVADDKRAWHAGVSTWPGMGNDINGVSIGIEFQCPVKAGALGGFTQKQVAAGIRLCRLLCNMYKIAPENVVGHSDIAPGRKQDPGILFPWERFVEAGVAQNPSRR